MWSYLKFRWHRFSRKARRKFWGIRKWSKNYLDRHVYGAWQKLGPLRWMFVAWVSILVVAAFGLFQSLDRINQTYITSRPAKGGIYSEGVVGEVRVVNPILPENTATADVNKLVFNGLTRTNTDRELEPDLAERWDVSADQKVYTFHLKKGVVWQDGALFSAKDVAFTIAAIQNPDSRSPLSPNWKGVKYEIVDDQTIRFTLPNSYTSFLSATTVGILPHHLLDSIQLSQLRINQFSQHPVGTGPYMLSNLAERSGEIMLRANPRYFRTKPYIDEVRLILYRSSKAMLDGYARKQILGISQIETPQLALAEKIDSLSIKQFSLPAYVGLFFNNKSTYFSTVANRQAVSRAINRQAIIDQAARDMATVVHYPILPGQLGFNANAVKYRFDPNAAKAVLANQKQTAPLRLVTLKSPEFLAAAKLIQQQLAGVGVNVVVIDADVTTLQQNYIRARNYDMLLYGQNLGADPDVYSFWHSSQADDPGLNVSNYKSPEADKQLESARLSRDPKMRATKFAAFVDTWAKDAPAMLIYSPAYLYGQDVRVEGVSAKKITEPSDRFYGIEQWFVRREKILKRDVGPDLP